MADTLFTEFEHSSAEQWKEKIIKDLKGISFESLVWDTGMGFHVKPFYTEADYQGEDPRPIFTGRGWDACVNIHVQDEKAANQMALNALNEGASGLVFQINKKIDTALLVNSISLEHIYAHFILSNDALHVLDDLKNEYIKNNEHEDKQKCFIHANPLEMFARYGEWHNDSVSDLSVVSKLRHIPVSTILFDNAGANTVHSLTIALAQLNEYLHLYSSVELHQAIHVSIAVGGDFFMEVARLRACRKLLSFLCEQYGKKYKLHIHCETNGLNKSKYDAYNNMLRSTTEAMSAIMGGCNSLSVLPYNVMFEEPNSFAYRIAINQQHILRDESYLDKVADMAAGSYYIECITDQLAERAWEKFKEWESMGGFIKLMESGYIQQLINSDFEKKINELKENKTVLVGVNKFQNPDLKREKKSVSHKAVKGKIAECIMPRSYDQAIL